MRRESETIDIHDVLGASRQALLTAAHDLKVPLGLIKLYALQLQSAELSKEERDKYLRRIILSAEQMLKMTTGLLETYRWSDQQLPLEPTNINLICQEVLHELSPYAKELGQTLQWHPRRRQHVVIAHHTLLHNVLFNITHNALKHTPEKTKVSLKLSHAQSAARIHVIDTGPGFEVIAKQLSLGNRQLQPLRSHGGTGLGLSIAKQLTRAMGGDFQLLSHRQGGHCVVSLATSRQLAFSLPQ